MLLACLDGLGTLAQPQSRSDSGHFGALPRACTCSWERLLCSFADALVELRKSHRACAGTVGETSVNGSSLAKWMELTFCSLTAKHVVQIHSGSEP